ncbi:MAG: holdfast anchor protein HfaD, partial [Hyphomonadaceae bacterium]|nr:holdfast anchor protein HfaD [Hyphomonadaceae bacterium]
NSQTHAAGSTAAANNTLTGADHGDLNVRLAQTASNSSYAITDVDACCTGTTVAGSSAVANAYGSSSTTSTVDARYTQNATGGESRATTDVYQYRAYDITAASTAAANSATINNEWGYTSIRGRQTSSTTVAADTRVTVGTWSSTAVASAYGVGNTTLATNIGSDMLVDIAQINTGGVDANAQFAGASSDGGEILVSSTAIGNAFTGYVCSQCGDAALSGTVNQSNGGNITSTGTISTNGAGAIIGSSSAIGNSATFITTQRGQ